MSAGLAAQRITQLPTQPHAERAVHRCHPPQPLKSSAEAVFATGAGAEASRAPAADMGPLGNFLLARWRESAARERMAQGGGGAYPAS